MGSLFVSYIASRDAACDATGWITITDCGEPQSTADIQNLCAKIGKAEGLRNVIPQYWKALADK